LASSGVVENAAGYDASKSPAGGAFVSRVTDGKRNAHSVVSLD
jgi:hypothetical protein